MKQIELPHKVCGCSCMINGLEDLYENQIGVRLPDWLLLHLSGLLGFVYIKNKNAPTPRMVFWGSNLARYQYEALADVVGFQWGMVSNRSFPFTLRRAKELVDRVTCPPKTGPEEMIGLGQNGGMEDGKTNALYTRTDYNQIEGSGDTSWSRADGETSLQSHRNQ
jgi:hypothetical protein